MYNPPPNFSVKIFPQEDKKRNGKEENQPRCVSCCRGLIHKEGALANRVNPRNGESETHKILLHYLSVDTKLGGKRTPALETELLSLKFW